MPIEPILKVAKAIGPKVKDFTENNSDKVIAVAGRIVGNTGKIGEIRIDFIESRGTRFDRKRYI